MDEESDSAIVMTSEQRETVEAMLRRRDLAPRVRERLEMIKGYALGDDWATIVQWSGRSSRTVQYWLNRFGAGGVEALADAPRSGRPARADAAYQHALVRVLETPPRDLDLPFDVWTSGRVSAYLAETTAVRICPGWLRVLIGRQDFVSGRPKHTLKHLHDPTAIAAFETEMAKVGEKNGSRAGAL